MADDYSRSLSVGEWELLYQRLATSGLPGDIQQVEERLQLMQSTTEAWGIADHFLRSGDPNVRFFGASTLSLKIKKELALFDSDTARTMLAYMIKVLVDHTNSDDARVVKTLCTALAHLFVVAPFVWEQPIRQVLMSLCAGEFISHEQVKDTSILTQDLYKSLPVTHRKTILWFTASLAAACEKVDGPSVHQAMEANVNDAACIMQLPFTYVDEYSHHEHQVQALLCYSIWVFYGKEIWPLSSKHQTQQPLRDLLYPVIQCLESREVHEEVIEVLNEILGNYAKFFQPAHMQALSEVIQGRVGPQCLEDLRNENPEGVALGELIIAFGTAAVDTLVSDPEDQTVQQFMQLQLELLRVIDQPDEASHITFQAVVFWQSYVDSIMTYSSDTNQPQSWFDGPKRVLVPAVEILWTKLQIPSDEVIKSWAKDDTTQFSEFRTEVQDLLNFAYSVLGVFMLQMFVERTIHALESRNWRAVEASIFCINSIADDVLRDELSAEALASLFRSSLFPTMADSSQDMLLQTRKSAVTLLGNYGDYIKDHAEHLPSALNFLFNCLDAAGLAHAAARSIDSLCSSCRHSLTGELGSFLQHFQSLHFEPKSRAYVKEKVMGAIAAIVQALPSEAAKVEPLSALLELVENDRQLIRNYLADGDVEAAHNCGVAALLCLASVGKGSQVPDDVPINLDDDSTQRSNFWLSGPGEGVQARIVSCLEVLSILGQPGEAIDAACEVLKTGYTEDDGPFVLPPAITVSLLKNTSITTPHLETILSTVGILITRYTRSTTKRIVEESREIYAHVVSLMKALYNPRQDTEVAQSCVDVISKFMPRYVDVLLAIDPQQLETVFGFTLQCLANPDLLPKRSAADFWTAFLKPLASSANTESLAATRASIMTHLGPSLSCALVEQIGGNALRSELDFLSKVLKALVFNHPACKQWLAAALADPQFPSQKVSDTDKRVFLEKVMKLRGGDRTGQVVKDFWVACRGTVAGFG